MSHAATLETSLRKSSRRFLACGYQPASTGVVDERRRRTPAALAVLTGNVDQSREGRPVAAGRVGSVKVVVVQPSVECVASLLFA